MNEFFALIMDNLVEFVIAVILAVITCFVIPWVKNTLAPLITEQVIPWLKEKHLYSVVSRFVKAAEKYNKTNPINKKDWVIDLLNEKGIPVTPEVEAYIESAVEELDIAIDTTISAVTNTTEHVDKKE